MRKAAGLHWYGSWTLTTDQRKAISDRAAEFVKNLEIEIPCPKKFADAVAREALAEARRYAANRLKDDIIEDLKERLNPIVQIIENEVALHLAEDILKRIPDLPEEVREKIMERVKSES